MQMFCVTIQISEIKEKEINKMKTFGFGVFLIIVGVILAQVFNVWWLYHTIVEIIGHIQHGNVEASVIAWDIIRILFRGVVWAFVTFVACIPGFFICGMAKVR